MSPGSRAAELATALELGDARLTARASRRRPGPAGGSSRCPAPRRGARRRAPGWPGTPTTVELARHVADDDAVGADLRAVADLDRAEQLRARADRDVVLHRRMALAGLEAGAAERHALVERHVVADRRGLADHDARAVVDEEALADLRGVVDLDPGQRPRGVGDRARQQRHAGLVQRVRDAVREQRLDARPGREHLRRSPTPSAEGSRSRAAATSRRTARATRRRGDSASITHRVAGTSATPEERHRDVALAGVRQDHDDPPAGELRAGGQLERARQRRAARDPGQDALLAREPARELDRAARR